MCIHNEATLRQYLKSWRADGLTFSAVVARTAKGQFIGSDFACVDEESGIANSIIDLKNWHPGCVIDLSEVNLDRKTAGLVELDENGLPKPTRPAQEELDKQLIRIHPGYAKLHESLQNQIMAEFMLKQLAAV